MGRAGTNESKMQLWHDQRGAHATPALKIFSRTGGAGRAGPSPPIAVVEVYRNPQPAVSHNKMWERGKAGLFPN